MALDLPTPGADLGTWGTKLNNALNGTGPGTLSATYVRRVLATNAPALASVNNHATQVYYCRGIDKTAGWVYVQDTSNGVLRQSENWGTSWSGTKGWPADVTYTNAGKIVRFGDYIWMIAKATASGLVGVYRATPQAGATALTWSGPLKTWNTGGGLLTPCLEAGETHLYMAEYGDPVGGPAAYRLSLADANGAGTNWETIYPQDASLRHFHTIFPDPFRAGHVYLLGGDGTAKTILRSTDYGAAGSWSVLVASSSWQAVQMSADEEYIWLAGDSQRVTAAVLDRDTGTVTAAATNHHTMLAVPGGGTDTFYSNAYYGAVDPDTGVYYCVANDTSTGVGNRDGMFWLPRVGSRFEILDKGTAGANSLNGEVFFGGGFVWSGRWHRPLLTV